MTPPPPIPSGRGFGSFRHPGLTRLEKVLLSLIAFGIAASLVLHFAFDSAFVDLLTDNGRWTVEIAFGLVIVALRWRQSLEDEKADLPIRRCPGSLRSFTIGLGGYFLGQVLYVAGVATGTFHFPGLSDVFYLLLPLGLMAGLFPVLDRELQGKKRRAVWLDMAGVFVMVSTLTAALYLPNRGQLDRGTLLVVGLYPTLFLTAFGMMLLTMLVRRIVLGPGVFCALLGLGGLAVSWLAWNLDFLEGDALPGRAVSYGFSVSHIFLFVGLATAREEICADGLYVRWLDRLHRLLPLLFVLAAGTGVLYAARRFGEEGQGVTAAVYIGSGAMVLCAMFRQILLLYEQDRELAAEYRLRERELYFQALFDHGSDLIFCVQVEADGGFRYAAINPAGVVLAGIDRERFIGARPADYFPGEKGLRYEGNYRRCVETGSPITYEQTTIVPTGSVVFENTLVPVRNETGRIVHIVGISRNVTAQKSTLEAMRSLNVQLELQVAGRTQELEAAYREMEAFSYSVSHDLRSPLRGINGFCNALAEDYGEVLPPEGRRYLGRVREASRRMGQIIDDLLTLSRLSRAVLAPADEVDLSSLARRIADGLLAAGGMRSAAVTFVVAPALRARCDPRLIEHVLENLLGNAWKYTGRHPAARIEFGSLVVQGETVYFVRDDGAGFDMRFAQKLFQNFQRLHAQSEFEGTGVGLAIVARIVHRHGGRIWAEGTVEQGATFYFTLESSPTAPPPSPRQDQATPSLP